MYTPGMIRHTIEELRNLGYTAEQARFIIRNCGTGAGGFSEGNDCAKGKAGKDGDGDGEFEGDKGGGGGKKGGGGEGGKSRQTEGASEEVSGEMAEAQRIVDQAPRAREVRKEIAETKKEWKKLHRANKTSRDPATHEAEKAAIEKLFALEKEAKDLPSEYDIEEAMDFIANPPTPSTDDEEFGKPLEPLFIDDVLKEADAANAKEEEAYLEQVRKDAPRALEVQKQIKETKNKIKSLRASQKKNPSPDKVREEKAAIKKLFALEAEAEGLPDSNDLVEAGVKVEEEKPARRQPRRERRRDAEEGTPAESARELKKIERKIAEAEADRENIARNLAKVKALREKLAESGKPRKKRSFSHRLMELRKAGLPISVAIRMSREDGDD